MRFRGIHWLILIVIFAAAQAAAQNKLQVTAPNNQTFAVAGKDRRVNADELIQYTLDFYKKNSTNQSGVDLLIVDDRVALVQDRAGAVYLEKKPDPGAIKTDGKGYVLSGNGAARKWILANLKVGDAVKIGEAVVVKNSSGEVAPAASIPCFAGAYYRKAVSSFDVWTGIAGLVKLGTPKIDENRLNEKDKQPLDNFGGRKLGTPRPMKSSFIFIRARPSRWRSSSPDRTNCV
jgi:hypothetical protein